MLVKEPVLSVLEAFMKKNNAAKRLQDCSTEVTDDDVAEFMHQLGDIIKRTSLASMAFKLKYGFDFSNCPYEQGGYYNYARGEFIQLIKWIRNEGGLGLREAKDLAEEYSGRC